MSHECNASLRLSSHTEWHQGVVSVFCWSKCKQTSMNVDYNAHNIHFALNLVELWDINVETDFSRLTLTGNKAAF